MASVLGKVVLFTGLIVSAILSILAFEHVTHFFGIFVFNGMVIFVGLLMYFADSTDHS